MSLSSFSPSTFRIDFSAPSTTDAHHGYVNPNNPNNQNNQNNTANIINPTTATGSAEQKKNHNASVVIEKSVSRLLFASQLLIVIILSMVVFGVMFMSYIISSNVNIYYESAQPYLEELRDRSMSMVRNADLSSHELEEIMSEAGRLVTQSVPGLIAMVNSTVEMVSQLDRVVRNPVLKVSME